MDRTVLFQQFCKEVILWSTLSHPNVLKLLGTQEGMEAGKFVTVSEWMKHGNIVQYIENYPVNRLDLVSRCHLPAAFPTKTQQQLHDAAQGLEYLHGTGLSHGDIKGVSTFNSQSVPF